MIVLQNEPLAISKLLPRLGEFRKVIVTGPQRSGTTVAAEIIGAELGIDVVREETFREDNLLRFAQCLAAPGQAIIQAPALSSLVHLINNQDIAVVFMFRDIASIRRSEMRIDWSAGHEGYEKAKYLCGDDPRPIAEIKYSAWNNGQCTLLGRRAFSLAYDSLKDHYLWVPPDRRANFGPRQTRDCNLIDESQ